MRAMWTGALSFGLVNIPVRLYSATGESTLKFKYLHKTDNEPIRYAKICKKDGKEVPFDDIVRGYEYQKGDFIVLTDEDFKRANKRATKTIDISDFVEEKEIESIYYEKPYYLEPDKGAAKPYALLHQALAKSKKVGMAKFVIRNKDHVGAIKPVGGVIVLNQLRFDHELRRPAGLDLPDTKSADKREIEMALQLINQLSAHFKPERYKDTYTADLEKLIEQKAKGKTPTGKGEEPEPTASKDLMAALRASLETQRDKPVGKKAEKSSA